MVEGIQSEKIPEGRLIRRPTHAIWASLSEDKAPVPPCKISLDVIFEVPDNDRIHLTIKGFGRVNHE